MVISRLTWRRLKPPYISLPFTSYWALVQVKKEPTVQTSIRKNFLTLGLLKRHSDQRNWFDTKCCRNVIGLLKYMFSFNQFLTVNIDHPIRKTYWVNMTLLYRHMAGRRNTKKLQITTILFPACVSVILSMIALPSMYSTLFVRCNGYHLLHRHETSIMYTSDIH